MAERVLIRRICEITGLAQRNIQSLAKQGKIPSAVQIGKLWTFDETKVRRWIERREPKEWRETSTGAARHIGRASPLMAGNIEEAYIRAIGLRRPKPSPTGSKRSGNPDTEATNG